MTKKIYVTRHGQTEFNKLGIVQGSGVDSDLNDMGRAQADAFYQAYKDHPFQKLYVTELKRTHQSMDGFIKAGLQHEIVGDLNEISWGIREGIPVDEEGNAYYQSILDRWNQGETNIAIEGGESPDEVALRTRRGMEYIVSQPEEHVLVCMHGRAMRIMLAEILNYPLSEMDKFGHENLCLYELEYTGSMFKVVRFCDTAHLTHLNA
ncbi:histidine phosphatase family protein [Roseivirga pacifica]|uniref:histidine phosphatase family protein n=1 Tax=Roseivirga pacifica TaxID=1267423 RepID=UPI00227AAFAC|nr:histidine phosphatase family protein [Roseivirga pacifica]